MVAVAQPACAAARQATSALPVGALVRAAAKDSYFAWAAQLICTPQGERAGPVGSMPPHVDDASITQPHLTDWALPCFCAAYSDADEVVDIAQAGLLPEIFGSSCRSMK